MTLAHAAYLFDLEGFRREFNVWRPDPDREDYVSFLTRAKVVLGEMPQVWDMLNRFRYNREDMKDYDESELGKLSTLVVLTQYLQQCPSIDYPTSPLYEEGHKPISEEQVEFVSNIGYMTPPIFALKGTMYEM